MDPTQVAEIEAALIQIPEIRAARLVTDPAGQPVEVHIVASGDKSAKQLVRDVQTVSLASFGVDLDHRIVSVVQFPGDVVYPDRTNDPGKRPSIEEISTETKGSTSTVRVALRLDNKVAQGAATGVTSNEGLQRMAALATLDALRTLLEGSVWLSLEHVAVQRLSSQDVAIATLSVGGGGSALSLSGSAVVFAQQTEAVVRSVLDAVNRRLWRIS
ncbi:MAG: hypothetical protein ABR507_12145 [Actinomycetota bacterium]|nr:hypothetical protein [Actinomycetota bacterium]